MRLSKKHEKGLETAYEVLSDVCEMGYELEAERVNLALDTLHEILESSRKQKAEEQYKRAFRKGIRQRFD